MGLRRLRRHGRLRRSWHPSKHGIEQSRLGIDEGSNLLPSVAVGWVHGLLGRGRDNSRGSVGCMGRGTLRAPLLGWLLQRRTSRCRSVLRRRGRDLRERWSGGRRRGRCGSLVDRGHKFRGGALLKEFVERRLRLREPLGDVLLPLALRGDPQQLARTHERAPLHGCARLARLHRIRTARRSCAGLSACLRRWRLIGPTALWRRRGLPSRASGAVGLRRLCRWTRSAAGWQARAFDGPRLASARCGGSGGGRSG